MEKAVFHSATPIVLASGSPRRRELLDSAGVAFRVVVSAVEEPAPEAFETPGGYALRMARLKARDVAAGCAGEWVLAADTVVAVGQAILGKPADEADARRMLGMLAGREHTVVTGCCLIGPQGDTAWEKAVATTVRFTPADAATLAAYAATGEPLDKAGGYAIQGQGAFLIDRVEGSYTNVVGLPLAEVVLELRRRGLVVANAI